jgi:hypothetical protein
MKTQYCTKCGEELITNARFCSSCGIEINSRKSRKKRGNNKNNSSWLLIIGGALLLIVGIWSVVPKPAANTSLSEIEDQHNESGLPYPEVERATVGEVKAAFDGENALIIDVRSEAEFLEGHMQGAISLPLSELESRIHELPTDQMIYLYCT